MNIRLVADLDAVVPEVAFNIFVAEKLGLGALKSYVLGVLYGVVDFKIRCRCLRNCRCSSR